jgi:hypothetical protein
VLYENQFAVNNLSCTDEHFSPYSFIFASAIEASFVHDLLSCKTVAANQYNNWQSQLFEPKVGFRLIGIYPL